MNRASFNFLLEDNAYNFITTLQIIIEPALYICSKYFCTCSSFQLHREYLGYAYKMFAVARTARFRERTKEPIATTGARNCK